MILSKVSPGRVKLKRAASTYAAEVLLSNENRRRCMKKFRSMIVNQDTSQATRQAAVLIPMFVKDDKVSLLFTLRAADLKSHRGQVSFPGGMFDDCDRSLEQTALRETHEELGIHPKNVEVWGRGNFITRKDLSILPIVGCMKTGIHPDTIQLNENEVEDVFAVSVEDLCNPKLCKHTQFRGLYTAPAFCAGAHRVWGLTAVITYLFLRALLPPHTHQHTLPYIPNVKALVTRRL